ncbi:hypothetical protein [Agromyces bauzanensis]
MDQSPFIARVEQLREMVLMSPHLTEITASRVLAALGAMLDVAHEYPDALAGGPYVAPFADEVNDLLGGLPLLLKEGDGAKLYGWARHATQKVRSRLNYAAKGASPEDVLKGDTSIFGFMERLSAEDDRLAMLEDDERFRSHAAVLVEDAERTASKLQEAAGIAGDAQLALHFASYARREWWSANAFRALTILAIIAALVLAAMLPKPHAGDWVTFSYRLAQLVGVAALATYLGRQAAQHRRVFNWARSMQVQLQSFPAFIEPVTDGETRSGIYDAFARRVLGPPPERSGKNDEAYPNQQVIELLTALAKKA